VSDRLFLLDKNYILKQAQQDLRLELQADLVEIIKDGYFQLYNPMRLDDDTTRLIAAYRPAHLAFFDDLYDVFCGIFRYQIGDNQLEMLFDGKSHYEKYLIDWKDTFLIWVKQLSAKSNFIIAGLELSVYYTADKKIGLAQNRMKICLYEHFGLKLYKHKGIQKYNQETA
jgi:hypothetical protein